MVNSSYLNWLSKAIREKNNILHPVHTGRRFGATLVVGAAFGYGPRQVKAFLASLRAHHDGPVAIITDRPEDLSSILERFGVDCFTVSRTSGYSPHTNTSRFLYSSFAIEGWYPKAETILLSDVRDVIFQADPFFPHPVGLEFVVEAESKTIMQHGANMRWMASVVGAGLARAMENCSCVCAGTIIGPRESVLQLVRQMLLLQAVPRSSIPAAFGSDQAAVNVIAHWRLISGAMIRPNYARVATIGMTDPASLTLDAAGFIRGPNGSASSIVHQYDRHSDIAKSVNKVWEVAREAESPIRRRGRRRPWFASIAKRLPEFR